MLKTISQKFHAWTRGWRVLLLLVATALMAGFIMPVAAGILALAANNSVLPLDLMFFFTPGEAFDMIEKYGPAGRDLYLKILLTVDILYPIVYTLFLGLFLSWLFQRGFHPESIMQRLNVMPVGALLFDLLENIAIVTMLSMYPSIPDILAWLTMIFGSLKWLFAFASIALIFVGLIRAAMNGFRRQSDLASIKSAT